MPEADQTEAAADAADGSPAAGVLSPYGLASAVLGALSVAALALAAVIWTAHRSDVDERVYQTRIMQTAADWTGVLINMNSDNVDASLARLRDQTVGELNVDFDPAIQPYREVVQRLKSHSSGRVEAVAVQSVRHDPVVEPDTRPPGSDRQVPLPDARRTDTVMVIATSIAETLAGKPQTVHWDLRLDVSEVGGKLLVSRLESIR